VETNLTHNIQLWVSCGKGVAHVSVVVGHGLDKCLHQRALVSDHQLRLLGRVRLVTPSVAVLIKHWLLTMILGSQVAVVLVSSPIVTVYVALTVVVGVASTHKLVGITLEVLKIFVEVFVRSETIPFAELLCVTGYYCWRNWGWMVMMNCYWSWCLCSETKPGV